MNIQTTQRSNKNGLVPSLNAKFKSDEISLSSNYLEDLHNNVYTEMISNSNLIHSISTTASGTFIFHPVDFGIDKSRDRFVDWIYSHTQGQVMFPLILVRMDMRDSDSIKSLMSKSFLFTGTIYVQRNITHTFFNILAMVKQKG